MEELKDPFTMESVSIQAGNETLVLLPLPFKKFRKALAIVRETFSEAQEMARTNDLAVIESVPDLVLNRFLDLAPIMFQREDLTKEFFEDNFSLPLARKVLEEAVRINGIGDFFASLRPTQKPAATEAARK